MFAVTWLFSNWRLVAGGILAALIVGAWFYVGHLRARVADLGEQLETARAVNADNLAEIDKLKADHAAALRAVEADAAAKVNRARAVATIKQDIRNAKVPEGACATVGPRLRAALDGLRRHTAAGPNPGGTADAPRRLVDLRPGPDRSGGE